MRVSLYQTNFFQYGLFLFENILVWKCYLIKCLCLNYLYPLLGCEIWSSEYNIALPNYDSLNRVPVNWETEKNEKKRKEKNEKKTRRKVTKRNEKKNETQKNENKIVRKETKQKKKKRKEKKRKEKKRNEKYGSL